MQIGCVDLRTGGFQQHDELNFFLKLVMLLVQ